MICMIQCMFPGLDLYDTDGAQYIITSYVCRLSLS